MTPTPRTPPQRLRDTLDRLNRDVDAWIASADGASPYLVPLSYLWDGETLLVATPASSRTARNLRAHPHARVALGPTRDVVVIDATVEALDDPDPALLDRFAATTGFDPRTLPDRYDYLRLRPARVQAWREANELTGRELMHNGQWVTQPAPASPTASATPTLPLVVMGTIRSALSDPSAAPKQGPEGAPDAQIELESRALPALEGLAVGDHLIVLTWLHRANRDTLQVHPRDDTTQPIAGVFATRSQDRPNPIGLHPVVVRAIDGSRLTVGPIEAIDGTPVLDIKIAL